MRRGVEVDLDLADLAAERERHRRARDGDERRAHRSYGKVEKLLLGETLARQRQLQDRHGRGVVVQDQRRRGAGRHLLEQRLRDRRDLRVGGANVDVRLEEDLDDADAVVGVGLDVLDVVDGGGQRPLERRRDAPGHLVGRQSRVLPDDADDGDANVGKDVGRRAPGRERADDHQQQRHDDEGVGPCQRDADDGDHAR